MAFLPRRHLLSLFGQVSVRRAIPRVSSFQHFSPVTSRSIPPSSFRRTYADESGFHSDFRAIRKKYETSPEDEAKVQAWIKQQIASHPVVVFMKGVPDAPQCGFSALACQILREEGVEDIKGVNVLEDPDIREGIKKHTNWRTIPQVFINKEFIGGSDILKEMFQSGELTKVLKEAGIPLNPPKDE